MQLIQIFLTVIKRDLLLAYRHRSEMISPILFYVIVLVLFPLALTPEQTLLQALAPGIIWVAALLATLLATDHIFRDDFNDGSLEQMLLNPLPLSLLVLAKVFAHWLVTGLPLILITPLLAMAFYLSIKTQLILVLSLLLGTPILSLLGAITVALTLGLRNSGILLALLALPLYIPVLIFGASAVAAANAGVAISSQLIFLGAFLVLALSLAPLATAGALRVGVS